MTTCPDCGANLPDDANFCRSCGNAVGGSCSNCGESLAAGATYCPDCGEAVGTSGESTTATDVIQLRPQEFARRADGSDLKASGLLNRLRQKEQVKIEVGNRALLMKEGSLIGEIGPGKHTLDSLGQKINDLRTGRDYTAILVSDGGTVVRMPVDDIRTASDYPIRVTIELVVSIDDPERFFTNVMADRDVVTADTFKRLLGSAIRDELEATVSQYEHEELYGNRTAKQTLRQGIERQCRDVFERNGLQLNELRSFDYEDGRDEIRSEQKEVEIRAEKEDIEDRRSQLDRRDRERETSDRVHEEQQRVREETTSQTAEHEIETQAIEHEHEREDMERRHEHKAEREDVEHGEHVETRKKKGTVERRELEHEQDVEEIEDLMDIKAKKDQQKLDREEREQDLDMRKEEHEVEVEKERLQARDDVDLDTLASMDSVDEAVANLAEIEKAEDLSPEQLEALGAQDSDELAKARQEAHKADKARERVADQKEFREEMKDVMGESMDRLQDTTESAMDNMGETGRAAAEDTSDNVIVSDSGRGGADSGDTTIVQGGGEGGNTGDSNDNTSDKVIVCPECHEEMSADSTFCTNCGFEF